MNMINNDWDIILADVFKSNTYINLRHFLDYEYQNFIVYPSAKNIYNALRLTSYKDTKVVILGQDPYHEPNQAFGLAFAVNKGIEIPPSLINIYKELESDMGIKRPNHGDLSSWAKEGVLLLNTTLTVRAHKANSHVKHGWEYVTDEIIKALNNKNEPTVFILWGNNAKSKKTLITNPKHLIIESVHPSPLSAYNGFFGSKPFSKTNQFLKANNLKEINWEIR